MRNKKNTMADKAEEFKKANATKSAVQERTVDGKREYLDEETGDWVSKGELKKRQTARKNAAKAAEKAAAKKAKDANAPAKKDKKVEEDEDDLDPSKYTERRKQFLDKEREAGRNPYPHKFHRDMTIPQFRQKYETEKIESG